MTSKLEKIIAIASIGLAVAMNNNAYAQGSIGITKDKNTVVYSSGSPIGITSEGKQAVFQNNGNIGYTQDGTMIIRQFPTRPDNYQQSQKPQNIDELIKQNPNQASLYIQKVDELIQARAPPTQIITTLETALKQPKLEGTKDEIGLLNYNLSQVYCQQKNYRKALPILEKVKKINPNYPNIDYAIEQTRKSIR